MKRATGKFYIAVVLFFVACGGEHQHDHNQADTSHAKHDSTTHHNHGHHHGDANAYMNQSEFQTLVDRFENPERASWQKPDSVVIWLGALKGKTIVDIGAGTGYFAFRLSEKAAKVIAADVDDRFIHYMDSVAQTRSTKNLVTRKAAYDKAPVEKEEADLVLLVDVYHHIENRDAYFKNMQEGLRKGGVVCIIDFKKGDLPQGPPDEMKLSADEVVEEMKKAGYRVDRRDEKLLPYQYLLTFKKG
jgi:ubiquinone/menaquinone biosynthesis C-methylase UbiE